ncbi:MAG TPA: hypothetical protein VFK62_02285 [Gaiellaceae bacterium]|nr:hypothetical protein [Gaiellaceae bacterium]
MPVACVSADRLRCDVIVDLDEAGAADVSAFGVLRRFAARLRRQGPS